MVLGQVVLSLICGSLWLIKSLGVEDIILVFSIIPDQYKDFPRYLEVSSPLYRVHVFRLMRSLGALGGIRNCERWVDGALLSRPKDLGRLHLYLLA